MRIATLIALAAMVFAAPSAVAQPKGKDLSGETFRRHACDCKKITRGDMKRWPACMQRRLAYVVDASTGANIDCPAPTKKK